MRALSLVAALVAVGLAGCADEGAAPVEEDNTFDDVQVEVTDELGAILGVVFNDAIEPIEGALVKLNLETVDPVETDAEGRFSFSKIEPGTYLISVSKVVHQPTQSTVTVVAGDDSPDIVKVQLNRLFEEDPYKETQHYVGHVGCAYNFGISSTCVNDYTRICNTSPCCPGGCLPFITGIVDQREYQSEVGPGWQSIVWEMAWESSLSGTAEEMGLTVSFASREGAAHWYTSTSQPQPFRLQCDVNVICPEQQDGANGEPMISPDGQDDLWNMVSAGDGNVAIQQDIEIFQTNFYYAPSPEGWSLIQGSPDPF